VVLIVCVVEIFTTDGINFSARSAKESGTGLAVSKVINNKLNKTKLNNIFLNFAFIFLYTKQLKTLITKKKFQYFLI